MQYHESSFTPGPLTTRLYPFKCLNESVIVYIYPKFEKTNINFNLAYNF